MTAAEVVAKAKSCVGRGAKYKLGAGGFYPAISTPWSSTKLCDCSGFACWCLGISRKTTLPTFVKMNGGWFNTTAIYADAIGTKELFEIVPWEHARPGMVVVWPGVKGGHGHIGVVTVSGKTGPQMVVHCSHGNDTKTGDAVRETSTEVFEKNHAIVARFKATKE